MKTILSSLASALFILTAFDPALAETVATVAGEPVTRAELESRVRAQLIEIENNRYEVLSQGLEQIVAEKLFAKEAKARGISEEQLRKDEIESKIQPPSEEEQRQVFEANKAQLGDTTFEQIQPRIVAYLTGQQTAARTREFIDELKKKYQTRVLLDPPKVDVDTGGREARGGGESAPVTIVAFSDYECPFCRRAEGTVAQVLETYGDKVRYVHRDYPLPFHSHAHDAAEAARCAGDQGKFWDYHDRLFETAKLTLDDLKQHATELGLDRTKFDECLASGKYKSAVDADLEAGSQVGVSGTPAFFINGRMLSGAQPFERFKEVIDAELARANPTSASK